MRDNSTAASPPPPPLSAIPAGKPASIKQNQKSVLVAAPHPENETKLRLFNSSSIFFSSQIIGAAQNYFSPMFSNSHDEASSISPAKSSPRLHHDHMCRSRKDARASDPRPRTPTAAASPSSSTATASTTTTTPATAAIRFSSTTGSASFQTNPNTASISSSSSSSTSSGAASLRRLSLSLPQNPTLYPFAEISAATNNFLSKRLSSSSSSSWRCTLRGQDVVVFQRAFRGGDPANLPSRLSSLCKSHHRSLVKLLGASLSGGCEHIYLVYEYVAGASLQECLRNPRNPNFTPLSKWISRMQVATDLAEGIEYMHHHCRTIHNRIKSSSILVTEPDYNAKICHFGAADLAGEIPEDEEKIAEEEEGGEDEEMDADDEKDEISPEISAASARVASSPRVWKRSDSRRMKIEGTRGYIAPEVIAGGRISHRSDVFAFGVVVLELISGREPLKYSMNRETKEYERSSLIETARDAIGTEDEDGGSEVEAEERRGRIRRWVDRRLRDSFPVEAAERLIRVALRCVEEAAFMRPEMTWVAGKVSRLFLDSKAWEERVRVPTDFSVSLAPR